MKMKIVFSLFLLFFVNNSFAYQDCMVGSKPQVYVNACFDEVSDNMTSDLNKQLDWLVNKFWKRNDINSKARWVGITKMQRDFIRYQQAICAVTDNSKVTSAAFCRYEVTKQYIKSVHQLLFPLHWKKLKDNEK